jgi:hypothetical protein
VIRVAALSFAALAFAALAFGSCGGTNAGPLMLEASGGPSGTVAATVPIVDEPGAGPQATCSDPVSAGACQLTSCQYGGIGMPAPGYGNFGQLTAIVGTTAVEIAYDGTGYPTMYFPPSVALGTGGIMRFRGGGWGDVPFFDVAATIPGVGVMTSPAAATGGGPAVVDTSQDLPVTWVPISIGQIKFQLSAYLDSSSLGPSSWIACTFDGAAGSAAVPQTLLATLKQRAGASASSVYADLSSALEATTVVDGLTIVTQSFQSSLPQIHGIEVTLQ